jgi:hypothetical protein
MEKRQLGFFKMSIAEIFPIVLLAVIGVVAHLPSVTATIVAGVTMESWLLSFVAFFIPIWNIIVAYKESK